MVLITHCRLLLFKYEFNFKLIFPLESNTTGTQFILNMFTITYLRKVISKYSDYYAQ